MIYQCVRCGADFYANPAGYARGIRCCSTECSYAHRKRGHNKQCAYCRQAFYCMESQIQICCSRTCSVAYRRQSREQYLGCNKHVCEVCGTSFTAPASQNRKYCSSKCYAVSRLTRPTVPCAVCGKPVKTKHDGTKYCSRACSSGARSEKVSYTCEECGEQGVAQPNEMRRKRFCSAKCRTIATLKRREPTYIEGATYTALAELGIEFEPQYPIGHFIVVDAYIPALNIVIEVQGDYWHANPRVYPNGPTDLCQRRTARNDRARFTYLRNRGYSVIQLWEWDIQREGAKTLIEKELGDALAAVA